MRAFIKDEEDSKTFNTFYNEERFTSLSRTNSRFSYTDRFPYDHGSVYWMDGTVEANSKLMLSLYSNLQLNFYSRGHETRLDVDATAIGTPWATREITPNPNNPFNLQNRRDDWGSVQASFWSLF